MAAKNRAKANGQDLDSEWHARSTWKQQQKIQEAERLQKVQAEALRQNAIAETQDLEKQRRKQQAQKAYQASLDEQLAQSRQRSFDHLKSKFFGLIQILDIVSYRIVFADLNTLMLWLLSWIETMSEAEMKLNADLIRKTGVVQIWDVHIMIYYFDFLFVLFS